MLNDQDKVWFWALLEVIINEFKQVKEQCITMFASWKCLRFTMIVAFIMKIWCCGRWLESPPLSNVFVSTFGTILGLELHILQTWVSCAFNVLAQIVCFGVCGCYIPRQYHSTLIWGVRAQVMLLHNHGYHMYTKLRWWVVETYMQHLFLINLYINGGNRIIHQFLILMCNHWSTCLFVVIILFNYFWSRSLLVVVFLVTI